MARLVNSEAKRKFSLIIMLLVATDLAVLLNIPILRQVLGFLFLTVLPGLLILYLLKLDKLELTVRIVLTVGLSIAFLMLFGLVINWAVFGLGYTTPLSTNSLVISFNISLLIFIIIGYKTNKEAFLFHLTDFKLNTREKAFLLLPAILPLLSIYGMHLMNTTDNNALLMALLFLIPAYVMLVAILNHKVPQRTFPITIFLIGISLLLMLSLRSNHIIGLDAHHEYYLFQLTFSGQYWQIFEHSTLDACLSISLLPTIYQSLLNINPEYLFKLLFPLMFSISSLVVYTISQKYIGNFYAFFACLFFMSIPLFSMTTANARTSMAILFFALAIMVLFHEGITNSSKRLLLIIFVASTILSHYSTAYTFFFVLLATWIVIQILPRIVIRGGKAVILSESPIAERDPSTSSPTRVFSIGNNAKPYKVAILQLSQLKYGITITMVALFFVALFFWYGQLTEAPFNTAVRFMQETFTNLNDFFLLESRSEAIQAAFGMDLFQKTIPQKVEFVSSWLTILLTTTGVLTAIGKYRRMVLVSNSGHQKSDFSFRRPDVEYAAFSLACCALLVLSLLFPYISRSYSSDRQYFQMMVPLSLFLVLGGMAIAEYVRLRPQWVLLMVLIPYFLSTSGALYQVFDIPKSVALNSEGPQYNSWYIEDRESYAAKWLGNNKEEDVSIYTDFTTDAKLMSQSGIRYGVDNYSLFDKNEETKGYIFQRSYNVVHGKLMDNHYQGHDIAEYQDKFVGKAKIYGNGGAEVYR